MEDIVWLQRSNEQIPWGFRLQGGNDFQQPLSIQRVTSGSIAGNNNLNSGDVILRIGDSDTASLSHAQAMSKIKSCGNTLELGISRGGLNSSITSPKVGAYNVHAQPDALHDIPNSMSNSWTEFPADSNASESPKPHPAAHPQTIRLDSSEFESNWQPKPGFGRHSSGSTAPNTWDNSEPLPYHQQGYANAPAGVVSVPDGPGRDPSNPPPPPPPLPTLTSPSSAPRAWNNPSTQSKIQQKTNQNSSSEYSSAYPFGAPSNYSSDSGFGQGSPVTNNHQTASSFGGYTPDFDLDSSYTDPATASQDQQKAKPSNTQRMPDAVLNMAAKGGSDKKPFSYIADVNDIKEHRDRVRKKTPGSTLPKYQHVLNLPQFEDPPRARGAQRTPATPPVHNPDSGESVVSNLQFNSPLQLYSKDNVVEALKGQTGASVTDVVGISKKDDKKDITNSAVYKMIHGIDQPKPKPVVKFAEGQPAVAEHVGGSEIDTSSIRCNMAGDDSEPGSYDEKSIRYVGKNIPSRSFRLLQSMTGGSGSDVTPPTVRRQIREPSSDDEVRFSGIHRSGDGVPSKNFQRIQIRAGSAGGSPAPGASQGGSEIDRTSIRQNLHLGDNLQDAGEYEQTSIRYTGRNIPSKSFRMLQSLTGGPDSTPSPPGSLPRRQQKRGVQQHQVSQEDGDKQSSDEPVDIRYVGGNIPSQSFKMLQHSIGVNDSPVQGDVQGASRGDTLASSQGRHVKVVRLRQQSSQEDSGSTDF